MNSTYRKSWMRCPTNWIRDPEILGERFDWRNGGADNVAALMCLTAIIHESDSDGIATGLTYDKLENATHRSRTSISRGLARLKEYGLIETEGLQQSCYRQSDFPAIGNPGWGKMPCKSMYETDDGQSIIWFKDFRLRKRTELDALKLFYLFIALRNNKSNHAKISYTKIVDRTKIGRNFIKPAISLLINSGLLMIDISHSNSNDYGTSLAYRITGIAPHIHAGTTGRKLDTTLATFNEHGDEVRFQ